MVTRDKESKRADILKSVCVFVSSSDNTKDVFFQVSRCFEKHWPNCPFPYYVGLNTPEKKLSSGFEAVYADAHQWQGELYSQLSQLPQQIRFILLFLDDFLIRAPVDTDRVTSLIERAINNNIKYLRLIPPSRAILPFLGKKLNYLFRPATCEEIKDGAPYFASLQVALWERDHLSEMLRTAQGIWDFENSRIPGIKHYAIIEKPPIRYVHVVEKGKWQPNAASLFGQAGLAFDSSKRQTQPLRHRIALWTNKLKFAILGYAVFRFKRRLKKEKIP